MCSCCTAGALSVNASPEMIEQVSDFGLHFGILFQLKDDLIDGEKTQPAHALLPSYYDKTLKALKNLPATETTEALRELTAFCAAREE